MHLLFRSDHVSINRSLWYSARPVGPRILQDNGSTQDGRGGQTSFFWVTRTRPAANQGGLAQVWAFGSSCLPLGRWTTFSTSLVPSGLIPVTPSPRPATRAENPGKSGNPRPFIQIGLSVSLSVSEAIDGSVRPQGPGPLRQFPYFGHLPL